MTAAIRTELRKLFSTRLWWILLIGMAGYMAFLAGVLGFALATGDSMTGTGTALSSEEITGSVYTLATSLGYVFPLVVGALIMTNEFRHQTATPTFLFEPRRHIVMGAKLVVGALIGLLFGLAGVLGTLAAGIPVLMFKDVPLRLDHSSTWVALALTIVALALWCMIGVGLGTVLPNQIGAIITILAFTQFVEPIVRLGLSAFDATAGIARFLPGAAAEAVAGSSFYAAGSAMELLGRLPGTLVMLAYVAVLAAVGLRTTLRKDIT